MNQSSYPIVLKEVFKKEIEDKKNNKLKICKIIVKAGRVLISLIWIAKFVLSLLLYHFIDSGDIKKYEDFLDCKGVKVEYFDRIKGLKKLRICSTILAVVSIISESLDKLVELDDLV